MGCSHSHINTQCSPSGGTRRIFSHANGHKGTECHPAIDCPKHLAPVVAIRPFERGRIVDLREAGWTYRRIATHFRHNVSGWPRSTDERQDRRTGNRLLAAGLQITCASGQATTLHHDTAKHGTLVSWMSRLESGMALCSLHWWE